MATGNHPDDGNDEITFNVTVAKQMTVPDEIMLTGPIDSPSAEPQMDTPRMVVPDDITFMDTLGGKNESIGGVLRKADNERLASFVVNFILINCGNCETLELSYSNNKSYRSSIK